MKMKKTWKKILLGVFTTVMFASIFTFIDMGWNVMEVYAAEINISSLEESIEIEAQTVLKNDSIDQVEIFVDDVRQKVNEGYTLFENGTYTMPGRCYLELKKKGDSGGGVKQYWFITKHKYSKPTCTTKASCKCGTTTGDLAAHNWTKDTSSFLKSAATCTSPAVYYYKCSVCKAQGTTTYESGKALGHKFSYTADGNVITAKCQNVGLDCPYYTSGITNTLNVPSDLEYNGEAKTVSAGGWKTSNGASAPSFTPPLTTPSVTIKAKNGSSLTLGEAVNVGSYTAKMTVDSAVVTEDFEITKKAVTAGDSAGDLSVSPSSDTFVYDGKKKEITVECKSPKTGMGGITVKYQKKNENGSWEPIETAPEDAGTYRVLIDATEGVNFNACTDLEVKQFIITKATPILTPPTASEITYGQTLADSELSGGVAKLGENTVQGTFAWTDSEKIPTIAEGNAGLSVTFTPTDSNNYNTNTCNVTLKVNQAIHETAPEDGEGYILKYPDETLVADPDTDYEVSSTNGDEVTSLDNNKVEPGKTYYVRYRANDNQGSSPWREIKVAPRPDAPNESVVTEHTDVSITMQMIPGVEYSIDGTNWFTATDEANNVTVSDGKITFGGLTKETKYIIRSRVKATDSAPHGEETTQEVTTKKAFPASDEERKNLFDIKLPADEDLIYNKKTKEAEVKLKDDADPGIGEPVIKYYKKNGDVEVEVKNPTDAGEYIVKVTTLPTDDYPALSPELKLGSFTIAKKEITISRIKANDKIYDGDATATLDYSNVAYDGIVSGDILFVSANGTFEAKEGKEAKDAGIDKTVAISDLALAGVDSVNYKLSDSGNQVSATASITPRELTEAMVMLTNKKFKETGSPIDVTAGKNLSVKYIDELTKDTDYELSGDIAKKDAGSYTLTVKGIGNFQGTITRNWQITERPVVSGISTSPAGPIIPVEYGKTPTITINGKQPGDEITYGDSENDISKESLEDVIKNFKDAGEYVIWYKVSRENHEPYEASIVLKIEPKELTVDDIVWGDESLEYNGKVQARVAKVKTESLISGDPCDVITTSTARNVGTGYTATATGLTNENYKLPEIAPTAPFSITPKSLTLKARNVSKYVGEKDPTLSYEAVGLCPGDIISGVSVSRNPGEGAGTYLIKVTVDPDVVDPSAANKNYTITTQYGSLVIKERPSDNEDSNGGSGNNNPVIQVVPVQKPVVLPIDALTANAANKNTKNTTGNNKGASLGADGTNAETDDSLGAKGAGNLTLHLEVSEHSPIETASIETPVTKLLEGSDVFTTEEALAIKGGVDARVWVHIDKLDMSVVPDSVHDEILSAAKSLEDDNVELLYFDISLFKQIGDGEIINIHEPGTHIEITLELPESVINTDDKVIREYKILRLHDGVIDVIPTTYNPDTQTISFATDKFSTYVLAYIDTPADAANAENAASTDEISVSKVTDDASSLNVWLFIIPVIIIAGIICAIIIYRKKREDDMTV